ncbi:putative porin [Alloalcanivorax xenomutans]|uniref:putative porin n=1 Tax=Alloalcanivorax xenomutans TaxID=1094342 RepID=UPI00047B1EF7|nr:putative porin [Alloalcanivorax xenomutans]ARB44760.1 hypothetical protein P40_04410 [Alloalcanivorax xenomutans]WOA32374.1 putative porin [Alloalcanivorax xenomutans]
MNMKRNQWLLMLAVAATLSGPAVAQAPAESTAPEGNSTTVHLIRLLVEQGVITDAQANALLQQARQEAQTASQRRPEPEVREGDVRVPYIPEVVRDEIREEVKQEVMAQAKAENWAAPNTFPDWVSRVKLFGDVRVRNESRFFSGDNIDQLVDGQKYNEDGPFETNLGPIASDFPPLMNTREDRTNLLRLRARFGLEADLGGNWSTGVRLATGSSNGPVSTTQTLGGGLSKKDIWLDQGWVKWAPGIWRFTAGRAENPFVSTDILFSGDLSFDGVSAGFKDLRVGDRVAMFGTIGAFPLEYSSDSWPSSSPDKSDSEDKWLFGAQVGANWVFNQEERLTAAIGYYHFDNIQGQRSSECELYSDPYQFCDTDWSRPTFMQKGNTLFWLRDIQPNPDADVTSMPQYLGLASEFQLFDLNLIWDTRVFSDYKLRLAGNIIYNDAYSEQAMWRNAAGMIVNNFDEDGEFESGRTAWMVHAAFGSSLKLDRRGDWLTFLGYKHIEPDALPDAYNDSSFHLGGTNAKGYYLGAAYALNERLYFQGRWMSSEEVYGPPLSIDILQLELNARF